MYAAAYITGFEVFSRMTGGAITYEFAKYAVIMFLGVGMFYRGFHRGSWPFVLFLLLLFPGIILSAINLNYGSELFKAISFNLSGPTCLAISALYCYQRKVPWRRMVEILTYIVYPLIGMTVYLFLYTPDLRDVLTSTESNFQASGGFGPNQVATVLGLGMFVLFTRLLIINHRFLNLIDLALLGFLSYRAIVTFSRGGVLTAAVCAGIFLIIYFVRASTKDKAVTIPKLSLIGGLLVITWLASSFFTGGFIDKRYLNQDAAGREQEDLSTGRLELINSELEEFYAYPLTGIGVGKMKEVRQERTGKTSATHNEISRLLSEHGLPGLLGLFVLVFTPAVLFLKDGSNPYLLPFIAFWFLTINHSSMRIAAPAFVYGLALLSLYREKKATLHRQPISGQG
ncbi:O-antigen ligase family protein [Aureitalea marina]|uniref:O-antigen ligase family protein n=1 Tax=Aureitalea marina TaxID=930804 RepID=UPI001FE3A3A2|nr:O-antigen ligase family protein [Aureitalea marina]